MIGLQVAWLATTVLHAASTLCDQTASGARMSFRWCVNTSCEYADTLRFLAVAVVLCVVFLDEIRGGRVDHVDNRPIWESARARAL